MAQTTNKIISKTQVARRLYVFVELWMNNNKDEPPLMNINKQTDRDVRECTTSY